MIDDRCGSLLQLATASFFFHRLLSCLWGSPRLSKPKWSISLDDLGVAPILRKPLCAVVLFANKQ